MNRNLRVPLLAIALLTLVAVAVAVPFPGKSRIPILSGFGIRPGIDLAGGAELRYRVLFKPGDKGDRRQSTQLAADVLRRRLEGKRLQEPKVASSGDDGIIVQLAGADAEGVDDVKKLIGRAGKLELHAAAARDLQERYDRDQVVPEGYMVVRNRDRSLLLIEEQPVIEGRHVVTAGDPFLRIGGVVPLDDEVDPSLLRGNSSSRR